jgi:WD40 repeat protein
MHIMVFQHLACKQRIFPDSDHLTLWVWDLAMVEIVRTLSEQSGVVSPVALTPDERYAISGSRD